ncbi:MAG: hypothetical protein KAR19_12810 [Bacteroidales bacterium]|nr:hypothetical protein [Bacteroidales bacterium]
MNQLRNSLLTGIFLLLSTHHSTAQENILDLYYSGSYEKVIGRTTEYIVSGDTAFNTFYLKALSEVQVGRTENAIQTLERAAGVYLEDDRITRILAGQYHEAGDYVKAWNRYSALDSKNLSSLLMLGEILNRLSNSGAIVYYERAYEIYPENQKVAYAMGN